MLTKRVSSFLLRSSLYPLRSISKPSLSSASISVSSSCASSSSAQPSVFLIPSRSFAKAKDKKGGKADPAAEPVEIDLAALREKMDFAANSFKNTIAAYKVGRATPDYLSQVRVKVGKVTKLLPSVGQVSIRSAQLMVVTVMDQALLEAVHTGLKESDLNLNPSIQQNCIHVPIPKATKDQRDEIVKQIKGKMEDTKAHLRRIRQEALQQAKKAGGGKDEVFRQEKEVQKVLDQVTVEVEKIRKDKETEINTL